MVLLVAACAPHLVRADAADAAHAAIAPGFAQSAPGASFAVADFDGDSRPDSAILQSSGSAHGREYWVRLHLSAGGRSYLRLPVPGFGLRIEARDVNGDHAIDLVFATPWQRRPVAILLNDGHGNFSQVDPSDYPAASVQSQAGWGSSPGGFSDATGMPQQSAADLFRFDAVRADFLRQADFHCTVQSEQLPDSYLLPRAERAPPFSSSLS